MIIDAAVYRDGQRLPCNDLSDEADALRDTPGGFIWIGLKDPTSEEFANVSGALKLHPLAVEDAVKGNQRSKLEVYESSLFVVLKPLHKALDDGDTVYSIIIECIVHRRPAETRDAAAT